MLPQLLAHCRPQPAIPALLVLTLTLMIALPAAGQPQPSALVAWGVPLGLVASAGLALAAGFCSFAPPVAWLALAWFASGSLRTIAAAGIEPALLVGTTVAIVALAIQAWRVGTRRFVPTMKKGGDPT